MMFKKPLPTLFSNKRHQELQRYPERVCNYKKIFITFNKTNFIKNKHLISLA